MNWKDELAGERNDPVVEDALKHFKASVHAWSEAAYNRPRITVRAAHHSWRLAASWALGCLLAVGSVTGAVIEQHHRQELARLAAMRLAAQKALEDRQAAAQNNAAGDQDEDLLATVNSDVSREVPTAMEPLAQLMDENGTK